MITSGLEISGNQLVHRKLPADALEISSEVSHEVNGTQGIS